MAAAVKAAYPETIVIGVDVDDRTRLRAMELGWVDHALRPDDEQFSTFLADSCELVVVATPVAAVDEYFVLLRDVGYTGVVTDTISTKSPFSRPPRRCCPSRATSFPGILWRIRAQRHRRRASRFVQRDELDPLPRRADGARALSDAARRLIHRDRWNIPYSWRYQPSLVLGCLIALKKMLFKCILIIEKIKQRNIIEIMLHIY